MRLAHWKDLCLDTCDPARTAAFWAAVLGLALERDEGGDAVLRGATPEQTVWVNQVPEPKTVKNRVHLDLVRPEVGPLLALGARVVQRVEYGDYHWQVLADPEGNELCVFDATQDAPTALVVDSPDPPAIARWWADVLDARLLVAPGGDLRWLGEVPGLPFDVVKFVGVDDPRTVKNRMHWDVVAGDVAALVTSGATVLREPGGDVSWHVLADPQGNEFCAFAP